MRSETGIDELEVVSDSELLVKQMRGEYKVKNEALRELFLDASRLARRSSAGSPIQRCAGPTTSWRTGS